MSQTLVLDSLRAQLKRLSLHTIAERFELEALKAAKSEMSYSAPAATCTAFLARLVEEELAAKTDRFISSHLSRARLAVVRTLEEFDFSFQPGLSAARVRELATLGFLERAENVVFVGRLGVGKTHLSLGLALRACQARKRVLFTTAISCLESLTRAEVSRTLGKTIETLGRLDLPVVDELGYTPIDAHQANLFFQLVSHMYTRTAMIVTSNPSFDAWGGVFGGDEVIAGAILDRLLHHSHVFLITGPSYRMKAKLAAVAASDTEGQDTP
jgi:DNA replication protein DnaC